MSFDQECHLMVLVSRSQVRDGIRMDTHTRVPHICPLVVLNPSPSTHWSNSYSIPSVSPILAPVTLGRLDPNVDIAFHRPSRVAGKGGLDVLGGIGTVVSRSSGHGEEEGAHEDSHGDEETHRVDESQECGIKGWRISGARIGGD